ncbi:MAG: accessory Sec system protein Asp2 [Pseudobutyrivibrio sp.]|nr:accessory Sec system protein Asp2 [Pseudobutyrivibrio sp.]
MDTIRILQIGNEDWNEKYTIPDNVKVTFVSDSLERQKDVYEITVIEKNLEPELAQTVYAMSMSYCFFATDDFVMDGPTSRIFNQRMGKVMRRAIVPAFLADETKKYFAKPYGEKFSPEYLAIAQGFKGKVKWNGQYSVSLEGDYGNSFNQIVFWKNNVPVEKGQGIDLWLEYKKDPNVEISLYVKQFVSGSLSQVLDTWEFNEEYLKEPVHIQGFNGTGPIFCSINARGEGKLDIIALHSRHSRYGLGTFMVGGERHVTSDREEIFSYFDPGDFKPPLAVYFSGYKTAEGFEGLYMMRNLGCPFLLISEQRFEGGGFYIGTPEYEQMMVDIIESHLMKLGFYPDQLILSGISMGTIGSLYYGCDLKPHALILGKPLASLGDIAANERLKRPKGFPTSLDLLRHYAGGMAQENIDSLNDRVWNKIRNTDFSHTKFVVSYMFEDDYDSTAYNKLLTELNSAGVQVYGKGLHGRHNDNSAGISAWFKGQYDRILKEDFDR